MTGTEIQILIATILYIAVVIGIGIFYAKKSSESSDNYLIGGRSLGPWVTAMSAEASDMSGWLLMGLPGVAYWCGLSDAFWTAIGLFIGTYVNWLFVARRIRHYSSEAGDAITISEFLSNRYREEKKIIMTTSAAFILIFFAVYAASCFVTVGKLFSTLFGAPYVVMMILGAIFVVSYTFIGGFLAESASDFMQGIVMIISLAAVVFFAVQQAGGLGTLVANAKSIPGFFEFFGIASPTMADGVQVVEGGVPQFGAAAPYGLLTVVSTMSWGLGYFGMPHILTKFMAIRDAKEVKLSRRIATVWCAFSLFAAVFIGLSGRVLFPDAFNTMGGAESIFILMARSYFLPFIAGFVMAGILAATISSSDSYLLLAASAFSKNIYQGILKKDASDKQVLFISRITLIVVAVVAMVIAVDENSVIFTIVSFAWAGFGATFGPVVICSLFKRSTTRAGAFAGMLVGGVSVFVWKLVLRPLGGVLDIYELGPAFLLSMITIFVVSAFTKKPEQEILDEFDRVKVLSDGSK